MLSQHDTVSHKRSFDIILGAVFSLLIGILAVVLGVTGLLGKGGAADRSTAPLNLLTGLASIIGAVGYLRLRKWAIPIYALAVVGHIGAHTLLFLSHRARGPLSVGGMVSIAIVPVLALLVLISMERHRRRGALS